MYAPLEWHVRVAQVSALRDKGIAIDASLVGVVAKDYLQDHGARDLVLEHGGLVKAGSTWCLTLLKEMGLSRRKCTTQAAKLPEDWEETGRRLTAQVNTNYLGYIVVDDGHLGWYQGWVLLLHAAMCSQTQAKRANVERKAATRVDAHRAGMALPGQRRMP